MADTGPVVTMAEMLRWNDKTATHWAALLAAHPEALELKCEIYGAGDVRGVLRHIMAVELRFGERLMDKAPTPYEELPTSSEELFALHHRNVETFRNLLADPAMDWEERLEFKTIAIGTVATTRRTMLAHALLHGIRHYAQLATLLREHGIKPDWHMDFLLHDVME